MVERKQFTKKVEPMNVLAMPRKQINFKIDDRLIDAFRSAAEDSGLSLNGYLEALLLGHLKNLGKIPMDTQPLPEGRGGKRAGSGKKRSNPSAEKTED